MVVHLPDDRDDDEMTDTNRPASPGSSTIKETSSQTGWGDPDLESLSMIKDMLKLIDTPSDITKPFAVRKAIYTALNHSDDNQTGYNASLRIRLYASYEKSSLNVAAKLFNSFMAFLMKPKMIIQGLPTSPAGTGDPGFFGRIVNRITGRGQPAQQTPPAGPQ